MTPLEKKLRRQIQLTGPVSVAEYMTQCLFDPDHGYYTTREPFGAAGDFTTSPEVSQMFGEIIAAWWVAARQSMGLSGMRLVEIGPGRGTLMDDMLRTIGQLAGELPAVGMVEASPRLAQTQKAWLTRHDADISWYSEITALSDGPLGVIANELFDALPIRQFQKAGGKWHERVVGLSESGQLCFSLSLSEINVALLPDTHRQAAPGTIFEYAPARLAFLEILALRLKSQGGFALFIDYGHSQSGFGDTLQAVRAHRYAGVLERPGECDLTSHVDFQSLANAAQSFGLCVTDTMQQGAFLLGAGMERRAEQLARKADAQAAAAIRTALARLTGQDEMGALFKVIAISSQPFDVYPLKFGH